MNFSKVSSIVIGKINTYINTLSTKLMSDDFCLEHREELLFHLHFFLNENRFCKSEAP